MYIKIRDLENVNEEFMHLFMVDLLILLGCINYIQC
jgi:hypothetical protein